MSVLDYYEEVYGKVPGWVQVMYDYNPKMIEYYTQFRNEAFQDGVLSAAKKDMLIAAVNADKVYARTMVGHTEVGQEKGLNSKNS